MSTTKQEKILKLIRNFSPKEFGIKSAYYRTNEDSMEIMFVVNKGNASQLVGYLNSLSSIIEKEVKGVKIESSVYIHDRSKKIENVVKKEKLESIELMDFAFAC